MISMDKKYKTRNGLPVELITVSGRGNLSVVGYIGANTSVSSWFADGKFYIGAGDSGNDLIEVKEKRAEKFWLNLYPDGCHAVHQSREDADDNAGPHRLACKEIELEYEEGEGL
jgi:hypothetical protein